MSNKINMKEKVLTCGSGSSRVVLCFDSGLVYQYNEPSNILAVFERNKWIVLKRPYHRSGGWGRPSQGNTEGAKRIDNTIDVLNSIGASIYQLNVDSFFTTQEFNAINSAIKAANKVIETTNKVLKNTTMEKAEQLPTIKLERYYYSKNKDNKNPKGIDAVSMALKFKDCLKVFIERKGKAIKVDSYLIEKDAVKQGSKVVAFRDEKGQVFMNSEVLQISDFEHNFMGQQSLIQQELRKMARYSIPFNVLESAQLKLSETKVLDQGPESTHNIKENQYSSKRVERHFSGALLLENNKRKFFMDIDRIEIEHGLFNVFFVEVDSSVNSILEAYDSMKPLEVKQAEQQGLKVLRQGEWFFVETDKTITINSEEQEIEYPWKLDNMEVRPSQYVVKQAVSHGKGRPNNLYKPVGFNELDNLVCGTVSHQGREHKDLDLGRKVIESNKDGHEVVELKLWKLIGNTTVSNFTITGDID